MPDAELGGLAAAFAIYLGMRVRRRNMCVVAALLVVEVPFAVAPSPRWLVGAVLGAEALDRSPGFHQRTVDREVFVRQKAHDLGVTQNRGEKLGSDIGTEQPVTVLRGGRVIPHGVVDAGADEPGETADYS